MDKKKMICRYTHCLHDTKEVNQDEAVKQNNYYYHRDCFKTKQEIKEIIDLFVKHINPNPVYSQLQTVIKNIVFTRKVGSELLLFGLKYYIENNIPLNYPQGLYYVIQNKRMLAEYKKTKKPRITGNIEIKDTKNENNFTHKPIKQKSITDILS